MDRDRDAPGETAGDVSVYRQALVRLPPDLICQ